MTRSEFRELYKQSLFEASDKWPGMFCISWRDITEDKLNGWLDRVMVAIPAGTVRMSDRRSGFAILCKKLGIPQTVKNIQAAFAACTPDQVSVSDQPEPDSTSDEASNAGDGQ